MGVTIRILNWLWSVQLYYYDPMTLRAYVFLPASKACTSHRTRRKDADL